MTFATKFLENSESLYENVQQTVIWNGVTYHNALMEKFKLSFFNVKDSDDTLTIDVYEEIPDNTDDTVESFLGTIKIPLDKLAKQYNTTVKKVRDIFGNKMGDWKNDSSYKEWYEGLEKFLASKHLDWNAFSLSELTFEYESDFTTTNIDQIIDDVLAGIIEYDTSLNQ